MAIPTWAPAFRMCLSALANVGMLALAAALGYNSGVSNDLRAAMAVRLNAPGAKTHDVRLFESPGRKAAVASANRQLLRIIPQQEDWHVVTAPDARRSIGPRPTG